MNVITKNVIKKYETKKERQFKQVLNSSMPLSKVEEYEPTPKFSLVRRHMSRRLLNQYNQVA